MVPLYNRPLAYFFRQIIIGLACVTSSQVLAHHESPDTLVNQFEQYSARLYKLAPAQKVRELKVTGNKAVSDRLAATVKSLLAQDGFGVVVIQDGEIVAEGYANGAGEPLALNSYSVAKTMTAFAAAEAVCAGRIKNLDDAAGIYAPAIADTAYGTASVRHLLEYRSGAPDPGGDGYSGIHHGPDFGAMMFRKLTLVDLMKKNGERRSTAGSRWVYNGLDSDALSVVVRGATGRPLQQWFYETVWQKAGGEHAAGWFFDRDGNGVGEVLQYFTTRDYARIGLYALERLSGRSDDTCMNAFLKEAASSKIAKGYWDSAPYWNLGMHTGVDGNLWFMGHAGQRIGINAKNNRVVAATGFRDSRARDELAMGLLSQ